MACCGDGHRAGFMTITQAQIDDGLALRVEYLGGRTVHVRGSVTGREYVFSGMDRLQDVDPRDAAAMLANGQFRLKGAVRRGK